MNNKQNNIIGGMNPVAPTENPTPIPEPVASTIQASVDSMQPQMGENSPIPGANLQPQPVGIISEPLTTPSTSTDLSQDNKSSEQSSPLGTIPISPVPGMPSPTTSQSAMNESQTQMNEQVNTGSVLSSNSNSVTSEISTNSKEPESTMTSSNNVVPELKLDSSSPFDIGIGANNESNSPLSNQTNLTPDLSAMNTMSTNTTTVQNPVNTNSSVVTSTSEKPLTNANPANVTTNDEVVSVKKYLGTLILFSVPIVGFIMLLIKAFSNSENKNISNLAKAQLLYALIIILLYIVIVFLLGIILTNNMVAGVAGM